MSEEFKPFHIANPGYGITINELTLYATEEILAYTTRKGTIQEIGFKKGKHLIEYLSNQFNGYNKFVLHLTNKLDGNFKIDNNKVFVNFNNYIKFAKDVEKTKNHIPEFKFGTKFESALYKTNREISLLIPKYFFDKKEAELQLKLSTLQNEETFELMASYFRTIIENFQLFDINRKNRVLKLVENSSIETEILQKIKKLKDEDPEKKLKEFLVSLSTKKPEEIIKVLNSISNSEKTNEIVKKISDKLKAQNLSPQEQKNIIENANMVSALAPRIKNLKESLIEFRKLLSKSKSTKKRDEKDIHIFLVQHYWLLGIEYYSRPIRSQLNVLGERTDYEVQGKDLSRPDFIIESIDGDKTNVYFELEGSTDKIIHKRGRGETGLAAKDLVEAINQAVKYTLQAKLNGEHPKGKVIIGQLGKNKRWREKLANISEYLGNIEILTYDDIVKKAENTINFFENYEIKNM